MLWRDKGTGGRKCRDVINKVKKEKKMEDYGRRRRWRIGALEDDMRKEGENHMRVILRAGNTQK